MQPSDQLREHSAREMLGVEANDLYLRSLQVTCASRGFWPSNGAELARLGDALGTNTHLLTLTLINDDAGFLARLLTGNHGFFGGLARNSSLSRLMLCAFDFSTTPAILGQLVTSSGNNAHIVHIHLFGCNLGNGAAGALASAVASSPNYHELHLGGNGIADDTVEALVSGIKGCRKPLRLDLLGHGSDFTNAGFESLATLVRDPACNLMSIQIAEISLDDERAEILATALKGSTTLQFLTLDGSITAQGWQSLARALCDDACPNETYHSNHTLHTIKQRIPPRGVHDHDVPANIKSLLRYNRPTSDKKVIAIEKLFRCHPVLDMTPFIQEWDLRVLPSVVDWFAMVERQTRMCVGERKLSSLYQFVRALPLMAAPSPKRAGDKRKANDIV